MTTHDDLLRDFDAQIGLYRAFAEKVRSLIAEITGDVRASIHSITCRPKVRSSFVAKISRVDGKYDSLGEVTDLAGIRIITHFADDIDNIAQLIYEEFRVDTANSVDKRDVLDPDRFGYLSLHYVVMLSEARTKLPEYARFKGLKAEIQIRSILQHAWAEIEHDLGYKTAVGVPRGTRRQFSRLAGLLELADAEFAAIRYKLVTYEKSVVKAIENTPEKVLLDKASLSAFVAAGGTVVELSQKIALNVGATLVPTTDTLAEMHAAALDLLGMRTIAEVEAALRANQDTIVKFAIDWIGPSEGSEFGSTVALRYLEHVLLAQNPDLERVASLLRVLRHRSNDAPAYMEKVVNTYNKVTSNSA